MGRATTRLRAALARGPVIAPSIYDCLTARLAELAGFEVLHLAGSGVEASLLGIPDLGLLSLTEVAERLGITEAAAKSRLLRARRELRARLTRHQGTRGAATLLA